MTDTRPGMGYSSITQIPLPNDVEAFLTKEGVPLNTRLFPGDRGSGSIQGIDYSFGGLGLNSLSNAQREKFLKKERLSYLYRMLKWWGYFDTPVGERRPISELLGTNPYREFTWNQYHNPRYQAPKPKPVYLPVEYAGGPLYMKKENLTVDPINQEEFVDGEKVNVLYTKNQLKRLNNGEEVNVKASMIFRPSSVNSMLERGSLINPMTREKTELRQRRTLHFQNSTKGGKRKRKTRKSTRRH